MKTMISNNEMTIRAAEALRAVLAEVSGTTVREISHPSQRSGSASQFTASVEVYGSRHTLACEIAPDSQPAHLRALLDELRHDIESTHARATPLLIAPHITDEARALCSESRAGFLDLEGNARIALGEVFILKRTLPSEATRTVAHHLPKSVRHTAA